MNNIFQVAIVTPRGTVFTHRARSISVRTVSGGLTIMANHLPIIAPLAIGPVRVTRAGEGEVQNYVAVNGGLIEFRDNQCTIIADTAERARDINVARAERSKEKAEKALREAEAQRNAAEVARAKIALNKAINRIGVSRSWQDKQ